MLLSILGFLIILGPLVVIHEFGHYIFARMFNVKAEVFSIGFGPKIWSRQLGETELRVSIIPLGGFVKLLGEDRESELSPAEAARSLHRQKAWKRFFIFFGGPLFNFLMAIALFMAILAVGEPQLSNVIGRVVHHSAAERAGFLSGDRVLSIADQKVTKFEEIATAINDHPGQSLGFEVQHPGTSAPVKFQVTPTVQPGFSVYGESTHVGEVDGLLPLARATIVGISDPRSLAAQAGAQTGDEIVAVNGTAISSWEDFEGLYDKAPAGAVFDLKLQEGVKPGSSSAGTTPPVATAKTAVPSHEVKLTKPAGALSPSQAWGLHSSELFVDSTLAGSPAEASGLKTADRITAVGNEKIESFMQLRDAVQRAGEKIGKVELHWERAGKEITAMITPMSKQVLDPLLKKSTQYTVGVTPLLLSAEPVLVTERILNPFVLVYQGTERMLVFSWRNFVSVIKMFTGEVSVKTLGGPIMIGKIAGESLSRGLVSFLTTMAMLSIGLGVLNILPVPVLDGGHLLLLGLEMIRRKPLTLRTMEIIQQVGLTAILLLMGIVLKNDFVRLFS